MNKFVSAEIDVKKILQVKYAMDEFLAGQTRRTGEPTVAHQYRVALRVMDTFVQLRNMYERGMPVAQVETRHVESAIIAAFAHDHCEDEYDEDEKGTVLRGGIHFGDGIPKIKGDGLILYQYWRDPNNIERDTQGNEVIYDSQIKPGSKHTIIFGSYMYSTLKEVLRGLNTNDGGLDTMSGRLQQAMGEIESGKGTDDIYSIITPLIIKFCDRLDNLATYFTRDHTQETPQKVSAYANPNPKKIFEKMNETLENFAEMERLMEQAIRIMRWRHPSGLHPVDIASFAFPRLNLGRVLYPIYEASTSHPLRDIFPTVVARLRLIGKEPGEIYQLPRYGAGLPRVM